jgi:hypothetical protein
MYLFRNYASKETFYNQNIRQSFEKPEVKGYTLKNLKKLAIFKGSISLDGGDLPMIICPFVLASGNCNIEQLRLSLRQILFLLP